MVDSILAAFQMSINAETLLIVFIGAFYGTIIGALPGLGTVVALTMCLPFTLHMENVPAIALLLAVYCGSVFGGSISAVLINTPGTPQSAATGMDGYPMAKRGQAGQALGWVTVASVTGGLASCVVLIVATPQMAALSIRYGGPLEICALICLGLACIATLSQGNQIKGLMMGVFGLLLATVGNEPVSGMMRFTFGNRGMETGIDMLPLVVGVFPLAEVFYRIYEERSSVKAVPIDCRTIVFPRLSEWKGRFVGLLRSSGIGILIGILPGTGPTAATFISYASAKRSSKNGANFGKGEPDGLIAAESANNAVTGGALVPTLALGIPGDATLALLLATFAIHNLTPGVRLMVDFPDVVYASFITLVIANLMLIPSAILTVRLFGTCGSRARYSLASSCCFPCWGPSSAATSPSTSPLPSSWGWSASPCGCGISPQRRCSSGSCSAPSSNTDSGRSSSSRANCPGWSTFPKIPWGRGFSSSRRLFS